MRSADAKVLDYGDVLLRQQDVELLEGPHWLNDQVISFWFEYLSREPYAAGSALCTGGNRGNGGAGAGEGAAAAGAGGGGSGAGGLLLLPPGTSFLLMHAGPHMAAEVLAPLQPSRCSVVAMAVNDNDDPEAAAGGSHWSLLVFHRASHTLRHYDSSPGAGNTRAARRLAAAVGPALLTGGGHAASGGSGSGGGGGGGGGGGSKAGAASAPRYVDVSMPSQTNSYDCGVYVLAMARAVCEWHGQEQQQQGQGRQQEGCGEGAGGGGGAVAWGGGGEAGSGWAGWEAEERRLGSWLTPGSVGALRREVLQLVRSKAAEQQRTSGGQVEGCG